MPISTTPSNEPRRKDALWYAAAAGAVVGLAAPGAQAQIVYEDIDDLIVTDISPGLDDLSILPSIDFDGDGDPEILFWEDSDQGGSNRDYTLALFDESEDGSDPDQVVRIVGNVIPFGGSNFAYFLPVEAGSTISSGAATITAYSAATFTFGGSDPNGFIGIGDTYLGVAFQLGEGTTHYAWIRVEMDAPGSLVVKDYAFNLTPDAPIEAGNMGILSDEAGPLLSGARLSAAYPNPFASEARFNLEVARAQDVTVEVFDVLGRSVQVLHDGTLTAGTNHDFALRGAELPNGVYLVRASGEDFKETRTVTLAR